MIYVGPVHKVDSNGTVEDEIKGIKDLPSSARIGAVYQAECKGRPPTLIALIDGAYYPLAERSCYPRLPLGPWTQAGHIPGQGWFQVSKMPIDSAIMLGLLTGNPGPGRPRRKKR